MKHALIALAIALAFGCITVLRPVDVAGWLLQAKMFEREASGSIVSVSMPSTRDNDVIGANRHVLETVTQLHDAGARRIFINMPLHRSGSAQLDQRLRTFLAAHPDDIFLTTSTEQDGLNSDQIPPTDAYFTRDMQVFSSDYSMDFLRNVWGFEAPESGAEGEKLLPLSFALAGNGATRDRVYIDYTILIETIPVVHAATLREDIAPLDVAGTTFVLGENSYGTGIRTPGVDPTPPNLVHILAAETLRRGNGHGLPWYAVTLMFGVALAAGLFFVHTQAQRRALYIAWCGAALALFVLTAWLGVKAFFADTLLLATSYAIQRGVARYRRRHLYRDSITGLANFTALNRDLANGDLAASGCLVVVKVARLDSIFARLGRSERRLYLREISNRLALGDSGCTIYSDGGKYLAFMSESQGITNYEAHLEGLRAIVSQPIRIGDRSLDVAITIGTDISNKGLGEQRLSSAIAAADQAREAYRPVFIARDDGDDWDHSLTAKLSQALADDLIAIKLQPQIDFSRGTVLGAEVLARWRGPDGQDVPPATFILQCERMGCLDSLTRRIFEKSFQAALEIDSLGLPASIAINVSAVQLVDDRIVSFAEECLRQHRVDPGLVTIELTETARIEEFHVARGVVDRLKQIGFKLSLDDFGVGSANYEAFFELPFDEVKIDRSFVANMVGSPVARAIVGGLLHTMREAGVAVVAEGIEDRETYDLLQAMGCPRGQGYFIAKPMTLPEYIELLRAEQEGPAIALG
ncbi:MAG: hypothetical protein CL808_08110 [Citromicrobium sp.]|nr:hypothetical protein [Citromicrobium sp.]